LCSQMVGRRCLLTALWISRSPSFLLCKKGHIASPPLAAAVAKVRCWVNLVEFPGKHYSSAPWLGTCSPAHLPIVSQLGVLGISANCRRAEERRWRTQCATSHAQAAPILVATPVSRPAGVILQARLQVTPMAF
jgi:hypothetical protein